MFKHIKRIASNIVQAAMRRAPQLEDNLNVHVIDIDAIVVEKEGQEVQEEPNSNPTEPIPEPTEPTKSPDPLEPLETTKPKEEPNSKPSIVVRYESSETAAIEKWRATFGTDDVQSTLRALIGMIQQLCLFSEPDKHCLRTYEFDRDDMTKMIEKIRHRPRLVIDTSDINTHDRVAMNHMYINMKRIIGMHHVRNFMVRVETAFDNSQIRSEHYALSRVACGGIDHKNHVVIPVYVQLHNIQNVPQSARTPFHHISYSIQPEVSYSRTIDTWYRHTHPNRATVLALCKQMAEAFVYLHAHNIVHGDVKPGNTLVQSTHLYVIDFGMSGAHDKSEGTGGTKPYCAPETGNAYIKKMNNADSYHWIQNRMENDVWSFGLMFFTMLALHKCIYHPNDYPDDFFTSDGHINPSYFEYISDDSIRALFERTLCPRETRYTAAEFLDAINQLCISD